MIASDGNGSRAVRTQGLKTGSNMADPISRHQNAYIELDVCTVSSVNVNIDRKKRHRTSRDPFGGCGLARCSRLANQRDLDRDGGANGPESNVRVDNGSL